MIPAKWLIWREDDNGVRAIVRDGIFSQERADSGRQALEDRAHKQSYYVAEDTPEVRERLGLPND